MKKIITVSVLAILVVSFNTQSAHAEVVHQEGWTNFNQCYHDLRQMEIDYLTPYFPDGKVPTESSDQEPARQQYLQDHQIKIKQCEILGETGPIYLLDPQLSKPIVTTPVPPIQTPITTSPIVGGTAVSPIIVPDFPEGKTTTIKPVTVEKKVVQPQPVVPVVTNHPVTIIQPHMSAATPVVRHNIIHQFINWVSKIFK